MNWSSQTVSRIRRFLREQEQVSEELIRGLAEDSRAGVRALAAQDKGIEVAKLGQLGHIHNVLKAALSERLGIDCGPPRQPGKALSPEKHKVLCQRLKEMGLV